MDWNVMYDSLDTQINATSSAIVENVFLAESRGYWELYAWAKISSGLNEGEGQIRVDGSLVPIALVG